MKLSAFALAAAFVATGATAAQTKWVPLNSQPAKQMQGQAAPTQQAAPPVAAAQQAVAQPAYAHAAAGHELLTNNEVISLVSAGLGPDTIVAKINASRGSYDTSTDALIRLKQANVPDAVIAAMVNRSKSPVMANAGLDNANPDPLAAHSPGIYVLDPRGSGQMIKIDATVSNQTKTSNIWGYAFSYGLSSAKLKTVIPNSTARVQAIGRRPTFYFFFNQSSALAAASDFSTGFSIGASSPNEFSLVHLERKGDHREAIIGSLGLASAKSGISDRERVSFSYDDVAPGVYKVTPSTDLEPGEYGFIYSVATGIGAGSLARIFDFSVS